MISVCMATYNGGRFIREQIESILVQLGADDELIVSDDGSKDDTLDVIASFDDPRVKVFHNEGRHGFVWNFENALVRAKGDCVFLADQDDVWKPNKVATVMSYLTKYQLVIHDAELIDGEGRPIGKNYYSCLHQHTNFLHNLWKTRWLGCCMAFRREVLDYCLPFPPKTVGHDYWIGMLGMTRFSYCFMSEVLMSYRRHGDNASRSSEKTTNSFYYMIFTKRGYLLKEIIKKLFF